MQVGTITCSYFIRIYDYKMPENMVWPEMCEKYRNEYSLSDTKKLFEEIAALGYDAVELWEPNGSHKVYGIEGAQRIKAIAEEAGLTIGTYCIGGWSNENVPEMETAYQFAQALGAPVITGCMPKDNSDAALDKMDELGEKYGIRFAIENHPAPSFSNPADIRAVLDAHSDWIGANLDTGIYIRDGYDPLTTAKLYNDRIYHSHFKDCKVDVKGCFPIGDGELDYPSVIKYLASIGFDGMLSVEFEFHGDPTPGLQASADRIKAVLAEV